jgi:hypothetical protein
MSRNYGSGVSRVLDPTDTGYANVIWQQGKPPTDACLSLISDIASDFTRRIVARGTPSGWLGNETGNAEAYSTNPLWSNWFKFGKQKAGEKKSAQYAFVNGWLVQVMGTKTGTPPGSPNDTDLWNLVTLDPPPANSGDFRIDYVFLEVWQARIASNPSTTNKPSASAIYKYGNVEGGASFLADDLIDPALGFETEIRSQIQYRIRVVKGLVGLASNPDGFDPAVVKAQGAATTATSYTFSNMRTELGDPGLWRAGDGTANALGTVDGYVYAVPICAVFRRNSIAWTGDPSPNLNGAFNRNPTAIDRTGYKTFSVTGSATDATPAVPLLVANLSATATSFSISPSTYIPIPSAPATPVLIKVGDELMTCSGIAAGVLTVVRGTNGTRAETHAIGTPVVIQSGRPDGLFSDQIATTDLLDLRHIVNPNGFNYDAVLKQGLDKVLKGTLRANWKRTGFGPQGTFLPYEDKIGTVAGTGITKLDAPDNIRMVYSDTSAIQQIEFIAKANSDTVPAAISETWSYGALSINHTIRNNVGMFSSNDVITVPIASFKTGLPGGDTDQVRFVNDGFSAVSIRLEGETNPLNPTSYTVTPSSPGPTSDLVITFGASAFPVAGLPQRLYITVAVQYGPGRGLARRPNAIHQVAFTNVGSDILTHHAGVTTHFPLKVAWAPLWSKFQNTFSRGLLPVTAEAYADLGSKTLVLQPFRKVTWPNQYTLDGTAANLRTAAFVTGSAGVGIAALTFQDTSKDFGALGVSAGDALVVTSGVQPGRYTVMSAIGDTLTVERMIPTGSGLTYLVYHAQGLMPLNKRDGVTSKWSITDPLDLFSGQGDATPSTKNLYITLPRHLIPGWGAYNLSIYTGFDESQNPTFAEGVNFGLLSVKGFTHSDSDKNYVPYVFTGGNSFATMSTWDFTGGIPATYNTVSMAGSSTVAGMRHFTDTRGLGRKGLELPPFYGIARLFAVYEKQDYATNSFTSAYEAATRVAKTTGSIPTNLLRQDFDGPLFWVELDDDGDSTFILNADAIDTSRSPNAITFDTGHFVIEASLFGFDRDAFDSTKECRIVLSRGRAQAISVTRSENIGSPSGSGPIAGPTCVLPGPVGTGSAVCSVVVDYSRTPYQGDAFGSQMSYADLGYNAGPLQTAVAYEISSTILDTENLTRPNQKLLEVLASVSFATTLGTGRVSGRIGSATELNFRNAGYEDPTAYPPLSALDPRPLFQPGAFASDTIQPIGTDYLGCTERLPLGSLFRDKDFRGGTWGWGLNMPLTEAILEGRGSGRSLGVTPNTDYSEISLGVSSQASGQPGEFIVHVDGEMSNYSLLTNYRTYRGGSAFTANGPNPGGEVFVTYPNSTAPAARTNVLFGKAFLVRNTVTNVGATEVSAGDELMLLVVTTAQQLRNMSPNMSNLICGTNGDGEGYSAADLYRLDGRPLVNDNTRPEFDPSSINLSKWY